MPRKHTGRRIFARLGWFAALLYMGGIFYLSSIPGQDLPLPHFPFADKVAHGITYFGLGVLIAFRSGLTARLLGNEVLHWTKGGWIAPAVGVLYGLLDEIHQLFTPNRTFDLKDLAVDIAGILLGFWAARRWDRRRRAQPAL